MTISYHPRVQCSGWRWSQSVSYLKDLLLMIVFWQEVCMKVCSCLFQAVPDFQETRPRNYVLSASASAVRTSCGLLHLHNHIYIQAHITFPVLIFMRHNLSLINPTCCCQIAVFSYILWEMWFYHDTNQHAEAYFHHWIKKYFLTDHTFFSQIWEKISILQDIYSELWDINSQISKRRQRQHCERKINLLCICSVIEKK